MITKGTMVEVKVKSTAETIEDRKTFVVSGFKSKIVRNVNITDTRYFTKPGKLKAYLKLLSKQGGAKVSFRVIILN